MPRSCCCNDRCVIFKHISVIDVWGISWGFPSNGCYRNSLNVIHHWGKWALCCYAPELMVFKVSRYHKPSTEIKKLTKKTQNNSPRKSHNHADQMPLPMSSPKQIAHLYVMPFRFLKEQHFIAWQHSFQQISSYVSKTIWLYCTKIWKLLAIFPESSRLGGAYTNLWTVFTLVQVVTYCWIGLKRTWDKADSL